MKKIKYLCAACVDRPLPTIEQINIEAANICIEPKTVLIIAASLIIGSMIGILIGKVFFD